MISSSRRRPLLAVFALLLVFSAAVSLSVAAMRGPRTLEQLDADEQEYVELARDLLHGRYEYQSFRVLGHVVILAGALGLSGDSLFGAQLLVSLLASLTAPLVWLLVRRLYPATGPPARAAGAAGAAGAAVVAAIGVALWPPIVFYNGSLYSETTALPLFVAVLCLLPIGEAAQQGSTAAGDGRSARAWRWLASGVALGLCIHVRPMYLIYAPFGALVACVEAQGLRRGIARAALLAAGCLAAVLPWSVHVSVREGQPVLLSTNGGCTVAGGLNPVLSQRGFETFEAPDGRQTWIGPGKWLPAHATGYLSEAELALPAAEQDALLSSRALAWIRAHPGEAAYLQAMKLGYMWGFLLAPQGKRDVLLGNVPTLGLLALGLAALCVLRRRLRALVRLWTLPLFVSAVALISWGSWRFRQPGDVGLIALCAIGLWPLLVRRLGRGRT